MPNFVEFFCSSFAVETRSFKFRIDWHLIVILAESNTITYFCGVIKYRRV